MRKVEPMTTAQLSEWNDQLTALLADKDMHDTMAGFFMVGGHLEKFASSWFGVESKEVIEILKEHEA